MQVLDSNKKAKTDEITYTVIPLQEIRKFQTLTVSPLDRYFYNAYTHEISPPSTYLRVCVIKILRFYSNY